MMVLQADPGVSGGWDLVRRFDAPQIPQHFIATLRTGLLPQDTNGPWPTVRFSSPIVNVSFLLAVDMDVLIWDGGVLVVPS